MTQNSSRMQWSYPSREDDPWFDYFEDLVRGQDASGYAHREDNSLIWTGGGMVSWNLATETLTWTGTINIHSPIGSRLVQIVAGSIVDWKSGEVVYVVLTRQPLANISASLAKASQLPSNDSVRSFAVRIGDVIYFRTGMSLGDGDSSAGIAPVPGSSGSALEVDDEGVLVDAAVTLIDFVGAGVTATQTAPGEVEVNIPGSSGSALEVDDEGVLVDAAVTLIDFVGAGVTATQTAPGEVEVNIPGGSTDKYTAKYIVGNGPSGDTLAECHFLDPGDGTGIVAAIAAAQVAGYPYPDVYIRPGTYDLGAGSPGIGMIIIPPGIRVRGAGRQCVQIVTADATLSVNPHAFHLFDGAELFDVKVFATTPASFPQVQTSGIVTVQTAGHVERVEIEFEDYWNSIAQPYFAMTGAAFYAAGPSSGTRGRFVECFAKKVPYSSFIQSLPYGFEIGGDIVDRCYVEGGYVGIGIAGGGIVKECIIENDVRPSFIAIEVLFSPHAQVVANKIIAQFSDGAGSRGISVILSDSCTVQANDFEATIGSVGAYAIDIIQSDDCSFVGNVGIGFADAINLDSLSDDNVVGFNNFAGGLYTDAGVGNDLAHNK